jgi:hypothetical protein
VGARFEVFTAMNIELVQEPRKPRTLWIKGVREHDTGENNRT